MRGDALLVRISFVTLFASLLSAVTAMACEEPIHLKQATGLDKVETNCGGCHSLDYAIMNSPFPTGAVWEAEVNK
jgi:mono/diheme cytochrome c family protein